MVASSRATRADRTRLRRLGGIRRQSLCRIARSRRLSAYDFTDTRTGAPNDRPQSAPSGHTSGLLLCCREAVPKRNPRNTGLRMMTVGAVRPVAPGQPSQREVHQGGSAGRSRSRRTARIGRSQREVHQGGSAGGVRPQEQVRVADHAGLGVPPCCIALQVAAMRVPCPARFAVAGPLTDSKPWMRVGALIRACGQRSIRSPRSSDSMPCVTD